MGMADNQQIIDTSAVLAASKWSTYGGSVVGAASAWIGSIDLAFWASIIIGLGGFLMNWYYARQKNKRDEELHKKLMGEEDHDKQN